jgi:PilZ domain
MLYKPQVSDSDKLRRHPRSDQSAPIQLVWKDRQDIDRFMNGRILDVSESGIRVELPDPLERQTYVTLQSASLGLHGTASVRSCVRKGMKYIVGLELSGGLKWKPKIPLKETPPDTP